MRKARIDPRRSATLAAAVILSIWIGTMLTAGPRRSDWSIREILDAIRMVESGDRSDPPDGDGGLAIGPYQIHRVYWKDALVADPTIGGRYDDCRSRAYAERIIAAFMQQYAAEAWKTANAEVIARTHNGGPTGATKQATVRYWNRVRSKLP